MIGLAADPRPIIGWRPAGPGPVPHTPTRPTQLNSSTRRGKFECRSHARRATQCNECGGVEPQTALASSGRSPLRLRCLPKFLLTIPQARKQAPTVVRVSLWMLWWDLTQPAYVTPCIKADRECSQPSITC